MAENAPELGDSLPEIAINGSQLGGVRIQVSSALLNSTHGPQTLLVGSGIVDDTSPR
jgi:hypothetical protein